MTKRNIFIAFLLYAALAVLMTLPLAANFSTHIPSGEGEDGPLFVWNAWWFGQALTTDAEFTYTNQVFAPDGANLLFHTRTYVHDALIFLLTPLLGLLSAFNLVFLLGFVASGLGTYLLIRAVTRHHWAALIGGIIFAFAPTVTARALGHFNLLAVWPLPWFAFFMVRFGETLRLRKAIFAGVIFGLAILNGFFYPFFLALLFIIFGLALLVANRKKTAIRSVLKGLALIILVAVVLSSPLLIAYGRAAAEGQFDIIQDGKYFYGYSADAIRYVLPSILHPLFGDFAESVKSVRYGVSTSIETNQFLGWSVLFLAFAGLIFAIRAIALRQQVFRTVLQHPLLWLGIAFGAFIFSLGPAQPLPNGSFLTLPYYGISELPFFDQIRTPNRYSMLVMLAVTVLASFALSTIWKSIKRPALRVLAMVGITFIILLEFLVLPLPITDARLPAIYNHLPQDTKTILHVPFAIRHGLRTEGHPTYYFAKYQLYQSYHGFAQVGGYLSRVDDEKFTNLVNTPGFHFLLRYPREKPIPEDFEPRKVFEALQRYGVSTIVFLRSDIFDPETFQRYIEEVMRGELIAQEGEHFLYRVPDTIDEDLPDSLYNTFYGLQ